MITADQRNALKQMMLESGAYELTKAIEELALESSLEMLEHGNVGAIIHSDSALLTSTVMKMKLTHPLRKLG